MAAFLRTFLISMTFGIIEEATHVPNTQQSKKTKGGTTPTKTKAKPQKGSGKTSSSKVKNPRVKPKVKPTPRSDRGKTREENFTWFLKNKKRAGLRSGDSSRTYEEMVQLFNSVPKKQRYAKPDDFQRWMRARQFGHDIPYKSFPIDAPFKHSDVDNMAGWQSKQSNCALGATKATREVKSAIREGNKPAAFDNARMNAEELKTVRKARSDSKLLKTKPTPPAPTTATKIKSAGTAMQGTVAHLAVGAAGRATGKVIGRKAMATAVGKALVSKLGPKVVKCVPVVGTVLAVGTGVAAVVANPCLATVAIVGADVAFSLVPGVGGILGSVAVSGFGAFFG